jgi:hypothetical protein
MCIHCLGHFSPNFFLFFFIFFTDWPFFHNKMLFFFFFFLFFYHFYICLRVYIVWDTPHPCFWAESVPPSFLILLKRNRRK